MAIILETERLISGEFSLADAAFMLQLLNTEGWLKYIGERNVKTIEQAETYLLNGPLKKNENTFPSLSRVELKSENKPIGLVSLIKREDLEFIDIGFAFLPDYYGKGYAFEMVSEIMKFAFREYKLEKIIAITLPGNLQSISLLEKLGMQVEGEYFKKETAEKLLRYGLSSISSA
jgi:RimJ/RimL family protein N-acetyltransferase